MEKNKNWNSLVEVTVRRSGYRTHLGLEPFVTVISGMRLFATILSIVERSLARLQSTNEEEKLAGIGFVFFGLPGANSAHI